MENNYMCFQVDVLLGYGVYMDIWLLKCDGLQVWFLLEMENIYVDGVIYGVFLVDGIKFVWSRRVKVLVFGSLSEGVGCYDIQLVDIFYGMVLFLSNIQLFCLGNVMVLGEVESILNDNSDFFFYSFFEFNLIIVILIYCMDIVFGMIIKLFMESFVQCFIYIFDGNYIFYMIGQDCDIFFFLVQGVDWWMMNFDGLDKYCIFWMNRKNSI